MTGRKTTPRVVVVGAGLAGISTAIALKKQLKLVNFTIYERASSVGGTWRDSTYPGCGSDVPGHWYSLSTELNPNWSSCYVSQPEIRQYWHDLWKKHSLEAHTCFDTSVEWAEWDSDGSLYKFVVENKKTGEKREEEAQVMIWAIGGFQEPLYPKEVKDIDKFKGETWHSAHWRHDVDLTGKTVGVIGNGCTGAQLVPALAKDPDIRVVNFCRTQQWYLGSSNFRYPGWVKWAFAHIPFVMRFYRNWIMARSDIAFLVFRKTNKLLVRLTRKRLSAYIRSKAPKEQSDNLIPNYAPGCKRIIVDPGYLESLHKPNVDIKWDKIESVVEDGIKLDTGEVVSLDVIVFSTGYELFPRQLRVKGRRGITIHQLYESLGGLSAYLGSAFPGFPNLYLLLGPNVATGHASVIFSEEAQINLAMQMIRPILDGHVKAFEIKQEVYDEYDKWVQSRIRDSVWTDCFSYYQFGNTPDGRNVATWPGPVALFWWMARKPQWDHWHAIDEQKTWAQARASTLSTPSGLLTMFLAMAIGLALCLPRMW